jgi:hypothetical protein
VNVYDKIYLYIEKLGGKKKNHENYTTEKAVLIETFMLLISRIRSGIPENCTTSLAETRENEIS